MERKRIFVLGHDRRKGLWGIRGWKKVENKQFISTWRSRARGEQGHVTRDRCVPKSRSHVGCVDVESGLEARLQAMILIPMEFFWFDMRG